MMTIMWIYGLVAMGAVAQWANLRMQASIAGLSAVLCLTAWGSMNHLPDVHREVHVSYDGVFVASQFSNDYHRTKCFTAPHVEIFATEAEALASGRQPCSRCIGHRLAARGK